MKPTSPVLNFIVKTQLKQPQTRSAKEFSKAFFSFSTHKKYSMNWKKKEKKKKPEKHPK